MESDSDDDSEASTGTTARRAWELQGDEPQNDEEDEPNDENDDDQNEENDERNAEMPCRLKNRRVPMESMGTHRETLENQLMRLRERLDR